MAVLEREHPHRGFGRSAAWTVTAGLATNLAGFLVIGASFRTIHTATLGLFLTVLAAQNLLVLLDPVMATVVARKTAVSRPSEPTRSDCRELRALIDALGTLGLYVTIVGFFLSVSWLVLLRPSTEFVVAILLLVATTGLQLMSAHLPGATIGTGSFRTSSVAAILGSSVNVLGVVFLIHHLGVLALALGQFLSLVTSRALLVRWRSRTAAWLPLIPIPRAGTKVAHIWADIRSLVLLTLATQVITWSDLVVIGAYKGSARAADYRLAVLVPTTVAGLMFRAYDVAFPYLASGTPTQRANATRLMTKMFAAGGGAILGGIIAVRADLLDALSGGQTGDATLDVTVVICLVWAANLPVHGASLQLVAEGRQRVLVPLVLAEAAGNVLLTVLLTPPFGIVGAATATLITIVTSNLIVLPFLLRGSMPDPLRLVLRDGMLPLTVTLTLVSALLPRGASWIPRPWIESVVTAILSGILALLAIIVFGGKEGRSILLTSLRQDER